MPERRYQMKPSEQRPVYAERQGIFFYSRPLAEIVYKGDSEIVRRIARGTGLSWLQAGEYKADLNAGNFVNFDRRLSRIVYKKKQANDGSDIDVAVGVMIIKKAPRNPNTVILDLIAVLEPYQNLGLGASMLEDMLRTVAPRKGIKILAPFVSAAAMKLFNSRREFIDNLGLIFTRKEDPKGNDAGYIQLEYKGDVSERMKRQRK